MVEPFSWKLDDICCRGENKLVSEFAIIKRSCFKAPVVLRVCAGGNRYHLGALLSVRTCTDFVILLADGLFLDIVPAYPAFYSTWSPIHILDRVM